MNNLSKKTIILLQIVVIVFIFICIKKKFLDPWLVQKKENFTNYDSDFFFELRLSLNDNGVTKYISASNSQLRLKPQKDNSSTKLKLFIIKSPPSLCGFGSQDGKFLSQHSGNRKFKAKWSVSRLASWEKMIYKFNPSNNTLKLKSNTFKKWLYFDKNDRESPLKFNQDNENMALSLNVEQLNHKDLLIIEPHPDRNPHVDRWPSSKGEIIKLKHKLNNPYCYKLNLLSSTKLDFKDLNTPEFEKFKVKLDPSLIYKYIYGFHFKLYVKPISTINQIEYNTYKSSLLDKCLIERPSPNNCNESKIRNNILFQRPNTNKELYNIPITNFTMKKCLNEIKDLKSDYDCENFQNENNNDIIGSDDSKYVNLSDEQLQNFSNEDNSIYLISNDNIKYVIPTPIRKEIKYYNSLTKNFTSSKPSKRIPGSNNYIEIRDIAIPQDRNIKLQFLDRNYEIIKGEIYYETPRLTNNIRVYGYQISPLFSNRSEEELNVITNVIEQNNKQIENISEYLDSSIPLDNETINEQNSIKDNLIDKYAQNSINTMEDMISNIKYKLLNGRI